MKSLLAGLCLLSLAGAPAFAQDVVHYSAPPRPGAAATQGPPFSTSVLAGDTLYVSGTIDIDPATGKPPPDVRDGARLVLNNIKRAVEQAGLTMNDLVWVQVFASNLDDYAAFNEVYRSFFSGPMPARAFIGAGALLNGGHFEVMGVARKPTP